MSFLNFEGNARQAPHGGRPLKEVSYAPSDIERREPLYQNGPSRVKIKGQYRLLYEDTGYEFPDARSAVAFWIEHQRRYLRECSDYTPTETFTRLRTRAEKEVDVQRAINGIKAAFIPRIASALLRKGPWDDVVHGTAFEVEKYEEKAATDLKERLTFAAGGELQLLILATMFPDLIKAAISGLPEGETPETFHAEQESSAARSKIFMSSQIRVAEEFLKKLPRGE